MSKRKVPFSVDLMADTLTVGDRKIALTPKETHIMVVLWEEMPRSISHEILFTGVWFTPQERNDRNALVTAVSRLRQKLNGLPLRLLGSRREGYRLMQEVAQ